MLTYETLRRIEHDEKSSNALTRLPEGFFSGVKDYLKKKEEMAKGKEDRWEYDNSKIVLNGILEAREKKILAAAFNFVSSGAVPDNLTPEEREFFDSVVEGIKSFHSKRKQAMEGEREKRGMIAILEDIPQFVGINMRNYGPFKRGDVATLPEENARLLLEKNLARRIGGG